MSPDPRIKAVVSRLDELKQLWVQTATRKYLAQYLEDKRPPEGWQITEAIAFALGSFLSRKPKCDESGPIRKQDNRLLQLALFLDVAELVTPPGEKGVSLFAQDPVFTSADEKLLRRLGIGVLHKPQAEHRIKHDILVFAPYMGFEDNLLARCRHLRPRIYIGNGLEGLIRRCEGSVEECEKYHRPYKSGSLATSKHGDEMQRRRQRLALLRQFTDEYTSETLQELDEPALRAAFPGRKLAGSGLWVSACFGKNCICIEGKWVDVNSEGG